MTKIADIDPTKAAEFLEYLAGILDEEEYSAYGIHTVLNRLLATAGVEGVRPQMMYNYLRNGLIVPGQKIYGPTLRKVTKEEVAAFLMRYCLRNGVMIASTPTKSDVNPDQLELDLTV